MRLRPALSLRGLAVEGAESCAPLPTEAGDSIGQSGIAVIISTGEFNSSVRNALSACPELHSTQYDGEGCSPECISASPIPLTNATMFGEERRLPSSGSSQIGEAVKRF